MAALKRGRSRSSIMVDSLVNSLKMKYDEDGVTERIERELAHEEGPEPKSRLARFRRRGNAIVHCKIVLMLIVLLNVVDCLLVTGELILDIHYIKGILDESDLESQKFIDEMQSKYPDNLYGHDIDHLKPFYDVIYDANCSWNNNNDSSNYSTTATVRRKLLAAAEEYTGPDSQTKAKEAHAHSIWEDISHGMHKASIAILGLLFVECLLKMFFMGSRFFHHKIEVFDAFIVIVSFILDLVFLKGLTIYRIQDGILVLSFLLPWRVIRVLNSLIVAVLDNKHFQLKMMFKQKKKLTEDLDTALDKTHKLMEQLKKLEDFLEREGMPRWKFVHYTHFDEKNTSLASMASLTLRSVMNNFFNEEEPSSPTHTDKHGHPSPRPSPRLAPIQSNLGLLTIRPHTDTSLHNGHLHTDMTSHNGHVHSDKAGILKQHSLSNGFGITNPGFEADETTKPGTGSVVKDKSGDAAKVPSDQTDGLDAPSNNLKDRSRQNSNKQQKNVNFYLDNNSRKGNNNGTTATTNNSNKNDNDINNTSGNDAGFANTQMSDKTETDKFSTKL